MDQQPAQLGYHTGEGAPAPPWWRTPAIWWASLFLLSSAWACGRPPVGGSAGVILLVGTWVALGGLAIAAAWRHRRRSPVSGMFAFALCCSLILLGALVGGLGVPDVVRRHPHDGPGYSLGRCHSNLKQIGMAILLYCNENKGQYPSHFEDLILTQDLSAYEFVCPVSNDEGATGATPAEVSRNLTAGGHLSYVYVGAGLVVDCDADTVVAYERPTTHVVEGMNVLFGDGHVEFMRMRDAREILDRLAAGERPVVWKGAGVRPATTPARGGGIGRN